MAERELLDITSLQRAIRLGDLYTRKGKISKIMGLMVEATGLECNMGDICRIQLSKERYALAEVVGILEDTVQLMPYQELDGIGSGSVVINTGRKLEVGITPKMLGRAVDALGSPIDGRDPFPEEEKVWYPINGQPSNPMERPPITEVMELGVRAIDGLLTMGKGQRMGIFAGSGVGKSTLMGMIARNVKADVNVIALVGERGREVVEFIDRGYGPDGSGGRHFGPAGDDALQMRPHRHRNRRVFPGSGHGCIADDGLPHPILYGAAGDRSGGRRAASGPWLYPVHLCRPSQAARTFGQLRAWLHHRNLHRPGGR